jgi:hypothetical protein
LLAGALLRIAVDVLVPQDRQLLALDDTPSKRYGPHVEGAGLFAQRHLPDQVGDGE